MKNKILTIGIPTYNRAARVVESVKEIQKLQIQDIEILIIDNNSQDETEKKMKDLSILDARINYIKNQKNIGGIANLTKILKEAQGEYIYLISDEDIINIEFIINIMPILESKRFGLIFGSIYDKISNSMYKKELNREYNNIFEIPNNELQDIVFRGYMSGIIFKKEKINLDVLYKYLPDTRHLYPHALAILTMIKNSKVKTINEIICFMKNDLGTETIQSVNKKKIEYWEPIARIEQIKFWIEVIEDKELNYNLEERKKLFSSLSLRSSNLYYSELFLKQYKNQRKLFYNSVMELEQINRSFVIYNKHLLLKTKLKSIIKKIIGKKNIKKIKNIMERIK